MRLSMQNTCSAKLLSKIRTSITTEPKKKKKSKKAKHFGNPVHHKLIYSILSVPLIKRDNININRNPMAYPKNNYQIRAL